MSFASRFSRLLFVSPWLLPVFLVIPLLVIVSVALNVRIFFLGSTTPLLVNNICFALVAGGRLLRYLTQYPKNIRYAATYRQPRNSNAIPLPKAAASSLLTRSGYRFDAAGGYGEKRDSGYLGTTIFYAGLFVLLSVGSWDNLQQFSGLLLDGMGTATDLNRLTRYRSITKGALAAIPKSLPKMQITNQHLPDSTYPMGATEIVLYPDDGKPLTYLLKPRDPVSYDGYDIYMAKLVFEPQIVIKRSDLNQPLFDSIVTLNPLVEKRGVYSFYGLFQGYNIGGGVYYQPEKSSLLVVISRNNKKVVTEMAFQVDQEVKQGDFIVSCAKMGQWSEIHVVHRRHKGLLIFGGLVALAGLLLRMAIRPQRVWLEETAEGCRVWTTDSKVFKLLAADN
jgi:hypothetical protein